jgi:tRNA(Ile)-lysidine synthase
MISEFKSFIKKEKLFSTNDRILLAVSGGIDSVAMTELFHQASYPFGIAHCNFQLRGKESDEDEVFVKQLAEKYNVPFYARHFATSEFALINDISVQMAARELRYQWFELIREQAGYTYVATAHHLDDQVETFFVNLLRNTGIAGFHGIPVNQGNVIRPMMFTCRKDIKSFVKTQKIPFREDSSNTELKYLRNKIRRELIPQFVKIHPGFDKIINETIERIGETEKIYREVIELQRKRILKMENDRIIIAINEILNLDPLPSYLYEFLAPYGFNFTVVKEIIQALDKIPGKTFFSSSHKLIKDRKNLFIEPISTIANKSKDREIRIRKNVSSILKPIHLVFKVIPKDEQFRINPSPDTANLDAEKIIFPLILRKWQHGDFFYPFGKNQRKKVSDYFIDEKIPVPDKEKIWLLCSGGKIAWIIGHRIDNRFRITQKTRNVLIILLKKENKPVTITSK